MQLYSPLCPPLNPSVGWSIGPPLCHVLLLFGVFGPAAPAQILESASAAPAHPHATRVALHLAMLYPFLAVIEFRLFQLKFVSSLKSIRPGYNCNNFSLWTKIPVFPYLDVLFSLQAKVNAWKLTNLSFACKFFVLYTGNIQRIQEFKEYVGHHRPHKPLLTSSVELYVVAFRPLFVFVYHVFFFLLI